MDDETASTMAAVGPRLRGLRTHRNLSLTDLAQATGISLSTLSRLESGRRRPNLELLLPLARVAPTATSNPGPTEQLLMKCLYTLGLSKRRTMDQTTARGARTRCARREEHFPGPSS